MKSIDQNLQSLRNEIINSEKAQAEFIKWKLILVAGVGSASLGFTESQFITHAEYLICLVPLICAYVDLVYFHLTLRIVVIGTFLRKLPLTGKFDIPFIQLYEDFAEKTREKSIVNSFAFEEWAIQGSSFALSILIVMFGFLIYSHDGHLNMEGFMIFLLSGIIGIVLTLFILFIFKHKFQIIKGTKINDGELAKINA